MTELAVIVTGAVGAAGIIGSLAAVWLTGRAQTANLKLSIGSENERARISEKRRVYAKALACFAVTPVVLVLSDSEEIFERTLKERVNAIAEVMLIAPQKVADLAEEVMDEFALMSTRIMRFAEEATPENAEKVANADLFIMRELTEAAPQMDVMVNKLANAMRADLGEETLEDDAEPIVREDL